MEVSLEQEVEAVLFATGRFIDVSHLADLVGAKEKAVTKACKELQNRYAESNSALRVLEEEGAWKLHVQDEFLELVSKTVKDTEVSGPVLETLAVIAWRSPVPQAEVVDIRGTNAYEHVKELVERGFINKEPSGRTYQLRVTDKFFDYFDIEGRDDIRAVFKRVEEEHREKEMELELAQKRLEEAMQKQGEGEEGVVPEEPEIPLSDKKVDIDDLDAVLEKSRSTREQIAGDMKRLRGTDEEEDGDDVADSEGDTEESVVSEEDADDDDIVEMPEDDEDISLEDAARIRKQAEADIEEIE